ncbi:Uncharacterised protein [Trueperella pyogenes]|nr:Uncharacterised protein [Trueperella pyogenes]
MIVLVVVPAQAGMSLSTHARRIIPEGGPCAGGDEPVYTLNPTAETGWSPRRRG